MGRPTLVWKATAPRWRLNLAPRDASSSAAPIEVYLAEYRAAPADVGRWLHEAVYWLRHDANTDLNLTLPADAEVLSASIDDEETAPLQSSPRRLWLPLTSRPAVCRVRVRWRYTTEDWARPNLDRPILEGAPDGPGLWTLLAPSGWRAESPERPGMEDKGDLHSGLTAAASLSWQRAEALLRISAALAQQAAEGGGAAALDDAQRRFYAECRRAREELEASPDRTAPGWPDGRKPIDVLQDLLERNRKLASTRHFEAVRAGAEAAVDADGAGRVDGSPAGTAEGRPLYAWTIAGAPAAEGGSGAGGRARAAAVGGVGGMDEPAAADRLSVAVVVGRGLVARLVAGTDRPDRIGRLVGGGYADADRGVAAAAGDRRPGRDDPAGRRPTFPPLAVPVEIDRSHAGAAAGIVRIVEVRPDGFAEANRRVRQKAE